MTRKIPGTFLLAATAACAIGAAALPAASAPRDGALQLAAADSIWCKVFGSGCDDQATPGGTQHAPDAPAAPAETPAMAPAAPAPAAAPEAAAPPPPPPAEPAPAPAAPPAPEK